MRVQILILGFKGLIGTSEIKRKSKREEKGRGRSPLLPSISLFMRSVLKKPPGSLIYPRHHVTLTEKK